MWWILFSACFAAVLLGNIIVAVTVAWFVGRSNMAQPPSIEEMKVQAQQSAESTIGDLMEGDPAVEYKEEFEQLSVRMD